jgi:hypothetical protein
MNRVKKKFSIWIAILALTLTLGGRAYAFMGGECFYALDNETISKLGNSHSIKVKDGVYHKSATIDFGDATLATVQPGAKVMAHGEEHILLEINKRTGWTQFVFINQNDINRFVEFLSGNPKPNP